MSTPTDLLWSPSPATTDNANVTAFMRWLEQERGLSFADYPELWRWSSTDVSAFWSAVWEFYGLDEVSDYDEVLPDRSMPGASWFPGARMNFAQRCFAPGHRRAPGSDQSSPSSIPDQSVDLVGLRNMNKRPPWIDTVVDPWSLPVGRRGEEVLGKLRCAGCRKLILDLQASTHADIDIRLHDGELPADVSTRRASEVPEDSGRWSRSAVQHGDVTSGDADQLVSLLPIGKRLQFTVRHLEDYAVAGGAPIRKGSQIRGPPADRVNPVVPATRHTLDGDRECLSGFRPGLLSGFPLNQGSVSEHILTAVIGFGFPCFGFRRAPPSGAARGGRTETPDPDTPEYPTSSHFGRAFHGPHASGMAAGCRERRAEPSGHRPHGWVSRDPRT